MATAATEQSIEWCNQARVLLKNKKGKSRARAELAKQLKALRQAMVALEDLSGVAAAVFEAEFHLVAERAHGLTARAQDVVVQMITDSAVATLTRVQADVVVQTALNKRLKAFDGQFSPLEIRLATLGRLPGAQIADSPVKLSLDTAMAALVRAATHRETAGHQRLDNALTLAVDALNDAVTESARAERAAEVAKKEAAQDTKDAKVWLGVKPQVASALQEMSRLPGAEAITKGLQDRWTLAQQMVTLRDGLSVGFSAALAQLGDFKADLQRARDASKQLMSVGMPASVQAAKTAAERSLNLHDLVLPTHLNQGWRSQVTAAADAGRGDEAKALAELQSMQTRIDNETQQARAEKQLALAEVARFDQLLLDLAAAGVPAAAFAAHQSVGISAQAVELLERQWGAARTRLGAANQVLSSLLAQYLADGATWTGYRDALRDIHDRAGVLAVVPSVRVAAQGLAAQVNEVLATFKPTQLRRGITAFESARCSDPAMALPAAIDELERRAREQGVPIDDPQALDDFQQALKADGWRVNGQCEKVKLDFTTHLDGQKSITPTQRALLLADFKARVDQVQASWVGFMQRAAGSAEQLSLEANRIESQLADMLGAAQRQKGDALLATLSSLAQQAAQKKSADLPRWIVDSLTQLRQRGENTAVEQAALDAARGQPDETAQLKALSERLSLRLDAWQKKQDAAAMAVRTAIKTEVKAALSSVVLSKDVREEMLKRCRDAVELTTMDDPDLLDVARELQRKLVDEVAVLAQNPNQHERNKARLKKLSSTVGDLMDALPETYRRLSTLDTETRVLAKSTDPMTMVKLIDRYEEEVIKAVTAKGRRKRELERYSEAKKAVEAAFAAMKKATSTRLTDKAAAFEADCNARLGDASAHKSREDGVDDAMAVLNALKTRLAAINGADNPEAALRQLDSLAVQDQTQVVEMARRFEAELANFKAVLLPCALATAEAADDGDVATAKSLKNVAGGAKRIVSRYMKLLTTLKRGAEPAPEMSAMQADFERARAMLADATRTAQRIIASPVGTQVTAPSKDGLRKLGVKWQAAVQAHAQALQTMAGAMRGAAATDSPDTQAAADQAARMVEALGSTLRADAFAVAFAGLMKPPPEDKAGQQAAERERLAQREAALRVMRTCRTELTENPLRRLLTDGSRNPFEAATLMAASATLRVTLKEIEVQALNSV